MSSTIHYSAITDPHLLDIVDEAWMRDKLPDDRECCRASVCPALCLWAL